MITREERAQNDEQLYVTIDELLKRLLGPLEELGSLTLEQGDEPGDNPVED